MRKFIAGWLVGVIMASFVTVQAVDAVRLFVNGKEVISDVPPQVINGRTMIPARPLAEALGATVSWDAENRAVVVKGETYMDIAEDFVSISDLVKVYHLYAGMTDTKTMKVTGMGHAVSLPMNASTVEGVSDTGVTVRGKVANGRLYISVSDLRLAGLLE